MPTSKTITLLLLAIVIATSSECPNPNLIIPNTFLHNIFETGFGSIVSRSFFDALIINPSAQTLLAYFMSQGAYIFTLWALAALTLLATFAFCVQLSCYNCCGVRSCGRKINVNSYSPCWVSSSVYIFMFFSFLLIAFSIATYILADDLITSATDTTCDIETAYDYLYLGSPSGFSPMWSGADNFNTYAQQIAVNFPNTLPFISTLFASTTYTAVTENTTNSLYNKALTGFTCPSNLATQTVSCPFPSNTSCANGSTLQTPAFSQNFCNQSDQTSALSLLTAEQMNNSTKWITNLISLNTQLQNAANVTFSSLIDKTSQLSLSFQQFKPTLSQAITVFSDNVYYAQIGTYVFLSFIILLGVMSFLSICCVFCTRNFNCRFFLYPLWICFAFFAIIFFAVGGVLLFGSFTTFNACLVYKQYTTSSIKFQQIQSFNGSETLQIINSCFFTNTSDSNIFNLFESTLGLASINNISNYYSNSMPASAFNTVENSIEESLIAYRINPNWVTFVGADSGQNAEAALDAANVFAANGGSACMKINDTLEYNPKDCYPLLLNQVAPSPSCILINNVPNSTLTQRQAALNTPGCSFTTYSDNLDALSTYGSQIAALVTSYLNTPAINTYTTNYFNYYEAVSLLLNNQTQTLFASFLQPYQNLISGSSCSFITETLNSLVNTSCNRDFPYIYSVTVLIICMGVFFFIMMILSYALTTRMEFYAFLKGDLSNYKQNDEDSEIQQIQMATMSNRQVLLKY